MLNAHPYYCTDNFRSGEIIRPKCIISLDYVMNKRETECAHSLCLAFYYYDVICTHTCLPL